MDKEKTAPGASDLTEGVIWKKLLGFFFPILHHPQSPEKTEEFIKNCWIVCRL